MLYVVIGVCAGIVCALSVGSSIAAYKIGYALGQLEASTAHTKLLTQQLAERLAK